MAGRETYRPETDRPGNVSPGGTMDRALARDTMGYSTLVTKRIPGHSLRLLPGMLKNILLPCQGVAGPPKKNAAPLQEPHSPSSLSLLPMPGTRSRQRD